MTAGSAFGICALASPRHSFNVALSDSLWSSTRRNTATAVNVLLMLAICLARLAEHILPYEAEWNKSHGDAGKDVTHGFAYELSGLAGLIWLQLIALTVPWQGLWPREWPLGLQLLTAIIVRDLAVTLLHYAR